MFLSRRLQSCRYIAVIRQPNVSNRQKKHHGFDIGKFVSAMRRLGERPGGTQIADEDTELALPHRFIRQPQKI
jgi:hypothetical protein